MESKPLSVYAPPTAAHDCACGGAADGVPCREPAVRWWLLLDGAPVQRYVAYCGSHSPPDWMKIVHGPVDRDEVAVWEVLSS